MGLKGLGAAVASVGVLAGSAWRVEQPSRTGAALAPILAQSSSDFQTALDTAAPGQTIVLQTGHVYEGPFYFRRKTGDGWITIQGDDGAKSLPGPGVRVTPADAASMPKLVASAQSVLIADPGAHHFRLVGLEIAPSPGVYLTDVVELGLTATTLDSVPHDFSFDRCYIHGDSAAGARRGIALNSANTEVINSYLADFKEVGFDSQALCGWNGPGPFTITNNYLEGAGENVMFGGADPTIPNLVPANITITRNHFEKPVSWRQDPNAPSSAPHWAVKNLLELKNAQHVVIDGNVFEYVWVDGQVGFAILFTPRNQDGHSPWSIVQDVTFTNNIVRHAGAGVDIIGTDDINTSGPLKQVRIANNLFADIGG